VQKVSSLNCTPQGLGYTRIDVILLFFEKTCTDLIFLELSGKIQLHQYFYLRNCISIYLGPLLCGCVVYCCMMWCFVITTRYINLCKWLWEWRFGLVTLNTFNRASSIFLMILRFIYIWISSLQVWLFSLPVKSSWELFLLV
jgi:hypothetical protein